MVLDDTFSNFSGGLLPDSSIHRAEPAVGTRPVFRLVAHDQQSNVERPRIRLLWLRMASVSLVPLGASILRHQLILHPRNCFKRAPASPDRSAIITVLTHKYGATTEHLPGSGSTPKDVFHLKIHIAQMLSNVQYQPRRPGG